jgi:hypothetical protein
MEELAETALFPGRRRKEAGKVTSLLRYAISHPLARRKIAVPGNNREQGSGMDFGSKCRMKR